MGVSPVSISLRLKSVGRYLDFCQHQKRLRFTTTVRRAMVSFRLVTGIRDPLSSTSSTKFLVARANIFRLDKALKAREERGGVYYTATEDLTHVSSSLGLNTNKLPTSATVLISSKNIVDTIQLFTFKTSRLHDNNQSTGYYGNRKSIGAAVTVDKTKYASFFFLIWLIFHLPLPRSLRFIGDLQEKLPSGQTFTGVSSSVVAQPGFLHSLFWTKGSALCTVGEAETYMAYMAFLPVRLQSSLS